MSDAKNQKEYFRKLQILQDDGTRWGFDPENPFDYGHDIYDDPSEEFSDAVDEFAKQLENHIIIGRSNNKVTVKPGKYGFETTVLGTHFVFTIEIKKDIQVTAYPDKPSKPYNYETAEQFKNRRGELRKPNLPNESVDEADEENSVYDDQTDTAFMQGVHSAADEINEGIKSLL